MKFYAKILLFGEHTIINGSYALASPLPTYLASWKFSLNNESARQSTQYIKELLNHLLQLKAQNKLLLELNFKTAFQELEQGLYLQSNIPKGYGVGSSGTVCAAVYQRFGISPYDQTEIAELKAGFAQMESFFHGSSSGLDPLICFLNQALLFEGKNQFKIVDIPPLSNPYQLFLLDTQIPRSTGPLVQYFQKRLEDQYFNKMVNQELIPYNESAIKALLQSDHLAFEDNFSRISNFQITHLKAMIPEQLHTLWNTGLKDQTFSLKICGAGGGGFMLGLTRDFDKAQSAIRPYHIIAI